MPSPTKVIKEHILTMEIESQVIETAQELFCDVTIPGEPVHIKSNFQKLVKSKEKLKEQLLLAQSIRTVSEVDDSLHLEPLKKKFIEVFSKNPGFKKLKDINEILVGRQVTEAERAALPSEPQILANFTCALNTSVNVEHFFSSLKDLMSFK